MENYKLLLKDKKFSGVIVVLDDKLKIIDANDTFLSLLDYSVEELLGISIIDLIIPDEKSLFYEMNFSQNVSNVMTLKFYHKSGAFRFFSFTISEFDGYKLLIGNTLKKDYFAKTFEYMSGKKSNLSELFESIEEEDIKDLLSFEDNPLSLVFDLLPVEVWVKDKLAKYVYVNETYTKATGISLEACMFKDDFQLFGNEIAKSFTESDQQAISSGKKISFSFETGEIGLASHAEVTKIPIYNKRGTYIGILGFSVNTTHTKAAEILLEQEKSRLLFILDNIDGMVFEINSKGEVVFISGKLRELLGFKSKSIDLISLFSETNRTVEAGEKLRLALNGKKVEISATIKGKSVMFSLNPVRNPGGNYNVVGFGSVVNGVEK